jgi:hypothetical protein
MMGSVTDGDRSRASGLIGYLHDCHQADSREFAVLNLLGSNVHHRLFLTGCEELASGVLERRAVDPGWAEAAGRTAAVYKRERSLIYATFLLAAGKIPFEGRERELCAPLVFYPAAIGRDSLGREPMAFVTVDLSEQRFNVPVLGALLGEGDAPAGALETFLATLPEPPFDAGKIHDLATLIQASLPGVDASLLYRYPELLGEKEVRQEMMPKTGEGNGGIRAVPAAALALIENPPETRGVLFELSALAETESLGTPLQSLFRTGRPKPASRAPGRTGRVPAILSAPQQNALASAAVHPLTLVIGPPGTGKTFTVASLALDHLARGESVLFASRVDQALDVIGDKLESLLGDARLVVRGGQKEYLGSLKDFLEQILRGVLPLEGSFRDDLSPSERRLARLSRRIRKLEKALVAQGNTEQALGEILPGKKLEGGFFAGFSRRIRRGLLERKLANARPQWELMVEYHSLLGERMKLLSGILKIRMRVHLEKTLADHREELKRFLQALRARTSSRQERLFREMDMRVLLKTFPVWMASLSGVHRVLPLERELFDLVIIDEATQCDTASCLPVLHRARRAVVTGDPKQLRHVSFLSRRRQSGLAERRGLGEEDLQAFDYREKSLLDVVEDAIDSGRQVVFLDEHFRSRPGIIAFSNREFYHGALKIMTEYPGANRERCVALRLVEGRRAPEGPNEAEARALIDEAARRVEAEARLEDRLCHSFGILSPFRDQVEHLRRLAAERLPVHAIDRHDLRIGTAHSFQGEERDVMFLSLVVDGGAGAATFRFLNRPDVFNVSITRARICQVVFASLGPEEAPAGSLLQRYLRDVAAGSRPGTLEPVRRPPADEFLTEVRAGFLEAGFLDWPAFPLAGLTLDLVVEREGRAMGIDLIGCPGCFAGAFPLERYRMLQRAGLVVLPLPYSAWRRDRKRCLEAIISYFEGKSA